MAVIRTLLGNIKGPKGDTGEQGIQGVAGNDGAAASIRIGTTTTAAAGTPARVENVGTSSAAVLDFTIPQGPQGNVSDISGLPVNQITSSSADFPIPAVGDTIATLAGKQVKATLDAQHGIADANADIAKVLGDLATVEAGATASQAYSKGDFLVKDGILYKVIAAISQGNALTVGGNIQPTTAGAEIASLNNDLTTQVLNATKVTQNNFSFVDDIWCYKYGRIISITLPTSITINSLPNDFVTVATVPHNCSRVFTNLIDRVSGKVIQVRVMSGSIQFYTDPSVTGTLRVVGSVEAIIL